MAQEEVRKASRKLLATPALRANGLEAEVKWPGERPRLSSSTPLCGFGARSALGSFLYDRALIRMDVVDLVSVVLRSGAPACLQKPPNSPIFRLCGGAPEARTARGLALRRPRQDLQVGAGHCCVQRVLFVEEPAQTFWSIASHVVACQRALLKRSLLGQLSGMERRPACAVNLPLCFLL